MIEKFEELIAWQKARLLTQSIYEVTRDGALSRDYGLSGQMQRAAVSIMSNVAEGFERKSRAEFCQFLTVAKASCAELRSQLYVALDTNYITEARFHDLRQQAEEVARVISGPRTSVLAQSNTQRPRV